MTSSLGLFPGLRRALSLPKWQAPRVKPRQGLEDFGAPGGIRTPDTQVRSLVLYPAELRALMKPFGLRLRQCSLRETSLDALTSDIYK